MHNLNHKGMCSSSKISLDNENEHKIIFLNHLSLVQKKGHMYISVIVQKNFFQVLN